MDSSSKVNLILGIFHLLAGFLLIVAEAICCVIYFYFSYDGFYFLPVYGVGYGFFIGILALVTGGLSLGAGCSHGNGNSCLTGGTFGMSIVTAVFCAFGLLYAGLRVPYLNLFLMQLMLSLLETGMALGHSIYFCYKGWCCGCETTTTTPGPRPPRFNATVYPVQQQSVSPVGYPLPQTPNISQIYPSDPPPVYTLSPTAVQK